MDASTIETRTIVSEIERAKKILREKALVSDTKAELLDNLYPILELIAKGLGNRVDAVEGSLFEILSQTESLITPEHGQQLLATLQIGVNICALLRNPKLNADARLRKELKRQVAAYLEVAPDTMQLVQEFTMDDDEEDDGGERPVPIEDEEPLVAVDADGDDGDVEDESIAQGLEDDELVEVADAQ